MSPAEDLINIFKSISDFDIDSLLSNPALGATNFSHLRDEIIGFQQICRNLAVLDFTSVKDSNRLEQLLKVSKDWHKHFVELVEYSKDPARFSGMYGRIESSLRNVFYSYWSTDLSLLNNLLFAKTYIDKSFSEYTDGIVKLHKFTLDKSNEIKKIHTEIEELLTNANKKVLDTRIVEYSQNFATLHSRYQKYSKYWLISVVVMFLLIIATIFCYESIIGFKVENAIKEYSADQLTAWVILNSSKKFILITILISALIWFARLYRVNKNLSIIYQHKANSLSTFEAFYAVAKSEQMKDYVLQETTRTIFITPQTGLVEPDHLPIEGSTKIYEFMKGSKNS